MEGEKVMTAHAFVKMQGLGNDFVIIDARASRFVPTPSQIVRLSDRRLGVGCDQLIVLLAPANDEADVHMRIFNADGSEVEACGNATRCVGAYLAGQGASQQRLRTKAGLLKTHTSGDVTFVDMGAPCQDWQGLGLTREVDTLYLPVEAAELSTPAAVGIGNPHMIFFVSDMSAVDVERLGRELTHHELYHAGTNVEFVEVKSRTHMRMRVWERGTGVTPACATGACASVVAGVSRGLLDKGAPIQVEMDGGTLEVTFDGARVTMSGAVGLVFEGTFGESLFD